MIGFNNDNELRVEARRALEALRGCSLGFSPFLDEWGVSLYISELKTAGGCHWEDAGGIAGAYRRIVAFSSCKIVGADEIPFIYVSIKPGSGLTRPPIQEAISALNEAGFAKDEDIGDIHGDENGYIAIITDRKGVLPPAGAGLALPDKGAASSAPTADDDRIKSHGLIIKRVDKSKLNKWAKMPSPTEVTVASLRFDAILSSCTKLSRSKAKKLIEANLAMVDYVTVTKAERNIEAGSIISAKGNKRLVIESIEGPTKKVRYRLRFNHFP